MTGVVNISAPMPTLGVYSGTAGNSVLPRFLASAAGGPDLFGLNSSLPAFTSVAYGGARSVEPLPALLASATGTAWVVGRLEDSLPMVTLSSSGSVTSMGSASINLPSPYSLIGYSGAVISATIGGCTLTASGSGGGVGSLVAELPLFQLSSRATLCTVGNASVTLPSLERVPAAVAYVALPMGTLEAIGTAVVAVEYEAYAVNLAHVYDGVNPQPQIAPDEVTRYLNFPFDYIIRHRNSYYGFNSTGMYLLESSTTDDGVAISYAVKTQKTDDKSPQLKTVESAYFAGRIGTTEGVSLYSGDDANVPHTFVTPRSSNPQSHRQVFGKGLRTRYYALEITGSKEFELDSIELEARELKRRI